MATNPFSNPWVLVIFGIIMVVIIYKFFIKKKDKGLNLKEFKPQPIEKTFENELKGKIDILGVPMKRGRLMIGAMAIGRIEKFAIYKGTMPEYTFDKKSKALSIKKNAPETPYEFILIRCKGDSFVSRLFGLNKKFFMLKEKDVTIDFKAKRMFLPHGIDLMSWGDIWTNNSLAAEYLTDISIKRMLLQIQSHSENMPDKIIVLETDTTRRERLAKTLAEIEKGRYEKLKSGEDTKSTE